MYFFQIRPDKPSRRFFRRKSSCFNYVLGLLAVREKRGTSSEEVHRLRRQLKKSKESRRTLIEQHDEAVNRLERAKEVCSRSKYSNVVPKANHRFVYGFTALGLHHHGVHRPET